MSADFSPAVSPANPGAQPYRFVIRRKAICPAGYIHARAEGTTLSGCPKFRDISTSVVERSRNVGIRVHTAGAPGRCAYAARRGRCIGYEAPLCARNNRCIIRFQSGLGAICIDLLSSPSSVRRLHSTYVLYAAPCRARDSRAVCIHTRSSVYTYT